MDALEQGRQTGIFDQTPSHSTEQKEVKCDSNNSEESDVDFMHDDDGARVFNKEHVTPSRRKRRTRTNLKALHITPPEISPRLKRAFTGSLFTTMQHFMNIVDYHSATNHLKRQKQNLMKLLLAISM